MRKELQRKLSTGQVANTKFSFETGLPGHRVTRKDKMVIIEKEEPKVGKLLFLAEVSTKI